MSQSYFHKGLALLSCHLLQSCDQNILGDIFHVVQNKAVCSFVCFKWTQLLIVDRSVTAHPQI